MTRKILLYLMIGALAYAGEAKSQVWNPNAFQDTLSLYLNSNAEPEEAPEGYMSGEPTMEAQVDESLPDNAAHGCIDATALTASYTVGYYGTFSSPYQHIGIINTTTIDTFTVWRQNPWGGGYYQARSIEQIPPRHLVINTPSYDPHTNYRLRTTPPGGGSSVRLGNDQVHAQAEALLYALEVDTLVADLLILKYAAVLEDPNHTPAEQPRFRLEIMNTNMEVMDSLCNMHDFIASQQLGWNQYGDVLWKNWTNVGIDLTPYAGQVIYVRVTTYDCERTAHFGYAYFTFECAHKNLVSENCGRIPTNTYTVTDGFSYRWYTSADTNTVLSTERSITVTPLAFAAISSGLSAIIAAVWTIRSAPSMFS